jgi:hypothetical protein
MADPNYYDSKLAGWWVWGISCWIAAGWCSGEGSTGAIVDESGVRRIGKIERKNGVDNRLPHLSSAGQGIHKKLPHLSGGRGVHRLRLNIADYFNDLSRRLRNIRVSCGDWSRITGPSVTIKHGLTGVLLDPPYDESRQMNLYFKDNDPRVSAAARAWAIEHGDDPLLRIALCGYEGEHEMPETWECARWHARGGYDGQNRDRDNQNRKRERVWFSPACLKARQASLWEAAA